MSSSPKHANRVPVYFTDAQYMDLLRSAAKFDKTPGEYIRFEMLRSMHGSLGISEHMDKANRGAFQCAGADEE
ncbi:MAG: hypothetical protein JJD98_00365 [Polaromonas sp.]|nr:hypothetical protein [Polaromonas sp.]